MLRTLPTGNQPSRAGSRWHRIGCGKWTPRQIAAEAQSGWVPRRPARPVLEAQRPSGSEIPEEDHARHGALAERGTCRQH